MSLFGRKRTTSLPAADPPRGAVPTRDGTPAEPPAIAELILADLAVRAGDALVRRSVGQGLLGGRPVRPTRANGVIRGRSLGETLLATTLASAARRSVPAAIVVGGALIAKILHDRKRRSAPSDLAGDGQG